MKSILLLLVFSSMLFSTQIKFLVGDVTVNGKKGKIGMKVRPGDTLRTGQASQMDILLYPETSIRIVENSEVVIQKFKPKKKRTRLALIIGKLQLIAARGSDFQVKTPFATAAIRGTILFCRADSKGDYFCTCNGSITYTSDKGEKKTVEAAHHAGLLITPEGKLEKAGMEEHTDTDIFDQLFRVGK